MAIEDVGILANIIQRLCKPTSNSGFIYEKLNNVARLYEQLRIPRTTAMLAASQSLGDMQLARSKSSRFETWRMEMSIWMNVKRYGTLPIMFQGSGYDYLTDIEKVAPVEKVQARL